MESSLGDEIGFELLIKKVLSRSEFEVHTVCRSALVPAQKYCCGMPSYETFVRPSLVCFKSGSMSHG